VAASVDTWYKNHQADSMATIAESLHIDEQAITQLSATLLPVITDALESSWFTAHITEMLQAFYAQPSIKSGLVLSTD